MPTEKCDRATEELLQCFSKNQMTEMLEDFYLEWIRAGNYEGLSRETMHRYSHFYCCLQKVIAKTSTEPL